MITGPTNANGATHAVQQQRSELTAVEADYKQIDDCVAGQRIIKSRTTLYLPMPNSDDTTVANSLRYAAYVRRAVFYNVTQRTLNGLVGEVFSRDPVAEFPAGLDVVLDDGDGTGLTLTQLAKRATRYTLSKGRAGVLADYPQVEGGLSKSDVEAGAIQPTITVYDANSIINWRSHKTATKTSYTLIVLVEKYDDTDDSFVVDRKIQYRVLRLVDGVYTSEIFRDGGSMGEPVTPLDHAGNPFDEIPFSFIGSENNDAEIDHAPMLALSDINIAHYLNSADYEEAVFMMGQPTPIFTGLTQEWVKDVMGGRVRLGSRGGVMLPQGADAKLLQMEANTAASEAMLHKEKQMVALGAKLAENKDVQRTATEAGIDNNSETSVLSDVAKNVSAALTFCLEMCIRFTGDTGEVKYELNTDYSIARMTPDERRQLTAEWQSGAISFSEMRVSLRKAGVASLDDDEARKEIDEDDFAANPNDKRDPNAEPVVKDAKDAKDDKADTDDPKDNTEE